MTKTKICSKCKIEQKVSCFHKDKKSKDRIQSWCINCFKQYNKDNALQIKEQKKQYYKNNTLQIAEQHKWYYKNNILQITEWQKQYRKENALQLLAQKKQYYKKNVSQILEKIKQHNKNTALFETYSKRLEQFEEIRRCFEDSKLLEVKCAYCGKWVLPTNWQVNCRIQVFEGKMLGEQRFYCSESCKQACPIYNQKLWPKGFKKATSREVVPLLRQFVLARDNYECQKCGVTIETAQLHVHHILSYMLNKIVANDPDNCITLCKSCHEEVHLQDGCKYSDLKCK